VKRWIDSKYQLHLDPHTADAAVCEVPVQKTIGWSVQNVAERNIDVLRVIQLTAQFVVAPGAAAGPRSIMVTTGSEEATLPNGVQSSVGTSGGAISMECSSSQMPAARPGRLGSSLDGYR